MDDVWTAFADYQAAVDNGSLSDLDAAIGDILEALERLAQTSDPDPRGPRTEG